MRHLQMGFMVEGSSVGDTFCGKIIAYDKATLEHLGNLEYTLSDGSPHLDYVEVNPSYRKRGVGRALITALVANLDLQYQQIRWAIHQDGIAFKERMDVAFARRSQDA